MRISLQTLSLTAVGLTALLAVAPAAVQAAPQALALVSTNGTVDLTCEGAQCGAEFTAFCLQPDRYSPTRGTPYDFADVKAVSLTGTTIDGRQVTLDAQELLAITAVRTHVAVRIAMTRAKMQALGLRKVAVAVGNDVTLMPQPVPDDENAHSEDEADFIRTALRGVGSAIIDRNKEHMVAARLTSRMLNALPGLAGEERPGNALWREATAAVGPQSLPAEGVRLAQRALDFCNFSVERRMSSSIRPCLEKQHDNLIDILNYRYWAAVKTGS